MRFLLLSTRCFVQGHGLSAKIEAIIIRADQANVVMARGSPVGARSSIDSGRYPL